MRIVFRYAWCLHVHIFYVYTAAVFYDSFSGLTLTSSVAGRHACLSEVVTFTCTARGHVIFWGNEEFGEITVHYQSPPSEGEFRAEVESYENNCLVSTLTLHATTSRNRTKVMCTNRDRSSNQSQLLHIMSTLLFFTSTRETAMDIYVSLNDKRALAVAWLFSEFLKLLVARVSFLQSSLLGSEFQ